MIPMVLHAPYVVTIDKSSQIILAIRRNWYEDDRKKQKRMHFVHYPYLPGMGFYGTGLNPYDRRVNQVCNVYHAPAH
jgi:hypothetical protein